MEEELETDLELERTVVITVKQMEAIRTVIEYLHEDEEDDYLCREPEDRDNHIWLSVRDLRDWYHNECCDDECDD